MPSHGLSTCAQRFTALILFSLAAMSFQANAAEPNPDTSFYMNGNLVGGRQFILGDSANWWLDVVPGVTKSASGKIRLGTTKYKDGTDTLQLEFKKKKNEAYFLIVDYSNMPDLTKYENTAALALEIKVDKKPKGGGVSLGIGDADGMGSVYIEDYLKGFEKGEWTLLPIPLNCFTKNGAKLTKTERVAQIKSAASMKIGIANVRLEMLPKGYKGCAE